MNLLEMPRRHPWKFGTALILLAAATWFLHAHRGELTRESVMAHGLALPAGGFIAAFLILPLIGFPVGVLLVLVGVRFGFAGGMAVAAGGVLFHNIAAYRISHGWLRERVKARFERAGYAIPDIKAQHRLWLTLLFTAVRGPPYVSKLYLLALTDIPARIYFGVGAAIHILFCLIPVGAGSAVMSFDPTWIYLFFGMFTLLLLAGYLLRKRFGKSPGPPGLP
jgi:uncharacterized membrane protein YdjX (TVP38/TMEM64 family)